MPISPGTSYYGTGLDTAVSLLQVPLLPVQTTLSADISSGALSIPLASISNLSASGIATLLDSLTAPTVIEKVIYTSISGSSLIIPAGGRGAFGTTAQAWTLSPVSYVAQFVGGEHHNVHSSSIIAVQAALDAALISVVWGTPAAESSNSREVSASCLSLSGAAYAAAFVDVTITVTDGVNDASPSHTATLSAATAPVGSVEDGTGSATLIVKTDVTGAFAIKVTETTPGVSRYLRLGQGSHSRVIARSTVGVLEVAFA